MWPPASQFHNTMPARVPYRSIMFMLLALLACASARAQNVPEAEPLYRYRGIPLHDSKWGPLAAFQRALADSLRAHGRAVPVADGIFGAATRDAIARLIALPEFATLPRPYGTDTECVITRALWRRLLPRIAEPTVHERAFVLSLSHEATDYDRMEWNYGTGDDRSALTWGPYGATVGWGNEVRAILLRIARRDSTLLPRTFGEEYGTIAALLAAAPTEGYAVLRPVFEDTARRRIWRGLFVALGTLPEVRAEYEAYAFATDEWLRPAMRRLYGLVAVDSGVATEIDYAFFLDLAMHMSITKERATACSTVIAARRAKLHRALTPAERRRVIAIALVPNARRADRAGRNVVYYIDGLAEEGLTAAELAAWRRRTGRRASDCGLADRPHEPPW